MQRAELYPILLHGVTGGGGAVRQRFERRDLVSAALVRVGAARMKRAAARRVERIRNLARYRGALLARHREVGYRREQHPGVGMTRRDEEPLRRRELDDAAQVHHADAIGD